MGERAKGRAGARGKGAARVAFAALALCAARPVAAQVPDSAAVQRDSMAVGPAVPDSPGVAAPAAARSAVAFAGPEPGRVVTPTPTRQPVFGAAELLGALPGAFPYDLGVPGAPDGVSFGGLAPERASLSLDGVPAADLFSGRPAWELLPLDALAPLRLAPRYGAPVGVDAHLRAFAASVPVTELRYRTAPTGIQFISATHAQTRRPGLLRRLGGDRARLQVLAHVGGRRADGEFAGAAVRGWQVLARIGIALPAFSLELTERHGRDESGARAALTPPTTDFDTVYDRDAAVVLDPQATRETVRNDLAATLRLPLLPEPLTATAFWTAETFRYASPAAAPDTLAARGDRVGFRLVQPVRAGPNRFLARAEGWLTRADPGPGFPEPEEVSAIHVALLDSLSLGGFEVGLEAGWHRAGDAAFPALGARAAWAGEAVHAEAGVRRAGALPSRMEREGFGGLVLPGGDREERTLALDASLDLRVGPFDVGLRAEALRQTDPTVLALTDSAAAFVRPGGDFRRATGTLALGWRDRAARGLYVRVQASAHAFLNPDDSPIHEAEADAVPPLWGHARAGWRARGLFDGSLDLDLALRSRFWTAFRSRALHAPTALYALPLPSSRAADGRATLDVLAEAGIGGGRATAFVLYENALAGHAYPGAYVVPVHPLPEPRLRFGVFWLLPG